MKILTPPCAEYFCGKFSANKNTINTGVTNYLRSKRNKKNAVKYVEGASTFDELKDCLIRGVERNTFLASSCYIRSLKTLRASSSFWVLVGLYYSCFFSAKALLSMHGVWMGRADEWIEVTNPTIGQIEITYKRTPHPALFATKIKGSHREFWTVFYKSVKPLFSYIDSSKQFSIEPVNSSDTWLIDERNKYNYQSMMSIDLLSEFINRYDDMKVPSNFPGVLTVFINISRGLRGLVTELQKKYKLTGDTFLPDYAGLDDAIDKLINDHVSKGLTDYHDSIN